MSRFIKIYFGPCAINVNFRNMASGKFLICYLRSSRHNVAELALVLQLQWRAFMGSWVLILFLYFVPFIVCTKMAHRIEMFHLMDFEQDYF